MRGDLSSLRPTAQRRTGVCPLRRLLVCLTLGTGVPSAVVGHGADNVYFAPRSAQVDVIGQQTLRALADRLAGSRRATVLLIGHSYGQGSRSYNLAITEERLVAVGKLLRSHGVAARQIRRDRVGSVRNAPDCRDEACWRQARRVELFITP